MKIICWLLIFVDVIYSFKVNNRPIIGIVTMKITDSVLLKIHEEKVKDKSYIAASYVKLIEMAGARVVPIAEDMETKELNLIFNSINGLLFVGGEVNLVNSGYCRATKKLFKMAMNENEGGNIFPILAICRGMQALAVYTQEDLSILTLTDSRNYTASLQWTAEAANSRLFAHAPEELFRNAEKYNITAHSHKYGIIPSLFTNMSTLGKKFKILATSVDRNNKKFVSIFEGRDLPFFGLQFHPEKPIFEWPESTNIPHSSAAVRFSQYISDAFIDESRKNMNRFKSIEEEDKYVLSKHKTLYIGNLVDCHFEQIYVF